MNTPLVLGIDGGGTSTTAWIADASGRILGKGQAGPSNIKAIGPNAAMAALDRSIRAAIADASLEPRPIDVSCLGLAGFDRPEDKRWLQDWAADSFWAREIVLVNDADLVLASGTTDGFGVALIAGTGSICIGRSPSGVSLRVGGWGHILGDEGSGYGVAVHAMRRLVRRADGRDPEPPDPDPLADRISRTLGIGGPSELVSAIYREGFDRTRIAALAAQVVLAADDGSLLAREVLFQAGVDLAEMVATVARRLEWPLGSLPLAIAGGFIISTPLVKYTLRDRLAADGFQAETTEVAEPVRGAVEIARRALVG